MHAQPRFRPGAGQLCEGGNGDRDVVPDAAHVEDHLVGMLLDQGPPKQRNHWMSSLYAHNGVPSGRLYATDCTWRDGASSSIRFATGVRNWREKTPITSPAYCAWRPDRNSKFRTTPA